MPLTNIPTPPSDSLYKFMAVSGVTGCLVIIILVFIAVFKEEPDIIRAWTVVITYNDKLNVIKEHELIMDSLMNVRAAVYGLKYDSTKMVFIPVDSLTKSNEKDFKETLIHMLSVYEELQNEKKKLRMEYLESKYITDKEDREDNFFMDEVYFVLSGLFCLSILIAISGFRKWKDRLQQYQDLILKKEVGIQLGEIKIVERQDWLVILFHRIFKKKK